jgi:Fe-S cluster assembly iron-binding protein IscA
VRVNSNSNIKENMMVEISESANRQIAEQLKGREVSAIRIYVDQGG